MDSISRETLVMKTFEEQSDRGEFVTSADSLPPTLSDLQGDVPSFPQKALSSNNIFQEQELSTMPPTELEAPLLPPSSPTSKAQNLRVGHSSGDSRNFVSHNHFCYKSWKWIFLIKLLFCLICSSRSSTLTCC